MTRLEELDFEDDMCLTSHIRQKMAEKLDRLVHYLKLVSLKVNIAKTKLVRVILSNTFMTFHVAAILLPSISG